MAFVSMKSPHSVNPADTVLCLVQTSLTDDGATGTYDVELFTLPKDSIVLDMQVICTQAEAGATTTTVDIEAGTGGSNVLAGTSDNLGTVFAAESSTAAELITLNTALASAAVTLNAEVTISGTANTAPYFVVAARVGRPTY